MPSEFNDDYEADDGDDASGYDDDMDPSPEHGQLDEDE